jgi:hypothetical protein
VLGADVVVVQHDGLFLGALYNLTGTVVKLFEQMSGLSP